MISHISNLEVGVEGKEEAKKNSSLKFQKGLSVLFILISLVFFCPALTDSGHFYFYLPWPGSS